MLVLAADLQDAILGDSLSVLSDLYDQATAAKLTFVEEQLAAQAEHRLEQLRASEELENYMSAPGTTIKQLAESMAKAQRCRVSEDLLDRAQHRVDQMQAEARLLRYLNVGVTGLRALEDAVLEAHSLCVTGSVMEEADKRLRRLQAIKGLSSAQDAANIEQVLSALEEARAAGLEPSRIEAAQARLERLLVQRGPQARVNLLLATEGRRKKKLVDALEQAKLCGVDARLLEHAEKVLEELGDQEDEDEPEASWDEPESPAAPPELRRLPTSAQLTPSTIADGDGGGASGAPP